MRFKLNHDETKYLIMAMLCAMQTMFLGRNMYVSAAVVAVQVFYVFYLVIRNETAEAVVVFTVFLCMSLEFEYITGKFYGLKSFRFFGITIAVWVIFLLFVATVIHFNYSRNMVNKFDEAYKTCKNIRRLNCIAIVVGAFMILVNDNDVSAKSGALSAFILEVYTVLTLVMIPAIILAYFISYKEFREKMKKAIHSILVVTVIQQYLSLALGITGNVTGQEVPLVSSVQLYGPFLSLYVVFKNQPHRKLLTLIGFLGWIISFKYSQGSGQYLMLFSIPLWIFIIAIQKKEKSILVKLCASAMFLLPILFFMVSKGTVAVQYKLEQAINFLNVAERNWRELLPMSARVRIEEIIDIFIEYMNKPYFALFGKGLMGTVFDYTGYFSESQWALGTSAYSEFEWNIDAFFSMHETINKLFLTNGLIGLLFLASVIVKGIKGVKFSPLVAIGIMWLIWYWCYSTTISWFGMACLMLGLSEASNQNRKLQVNGLER